MLHFIRKIDSGRFGKVVLVGGSAGGQFAVKLFRQQHDQPGRVSTSAQLEVANFNRCEPWSAKHGVSRPR